MKKPNLLVHRREADDEVGDRKEGHAGQSVPRLPTQGLSYADDTGLETGFQLGPRISGVVVAAHEVADVEGPRCLMPSNPCLRAGRFKGISAFEPEPRGLDDRFAVPAMQVHDDALSTRALCTAVVHMLDVIGDRTLV